MSYFKIILLAILLASFVSCSSSQGDKRSMELKAEEESKETPKALSGSDQSIWKTRLSSYERQLIHELYIEAKAKDIKLNTLDRKISLQLSARFDSLSAYTLYIRNSEQYWSEYGMNVNQLKDTLGAKFMIEFLTKEKERFELDMTEHKQLISYINKEVEELQDNLILLMLRTTYPLFENYIRNEKPDKQKIQNLLQDFKELNDEIDDYVSIKK